MTCFIGLFLLLSLSPTLAQEQNPQFGIIEAYEAPEAATKLGVGWTRLRFQWAEIQPDSAEQWQMERLSEQHIDAEVAAGREIVGLLIGIPDWARDENNLPSGLYAPLDDPENLWATFVRSTVKRYEDEIDHWIIWNEPDIWDKEALGHTWDGTEADFAQLMRVAYLVANESNPDAVIHLASMTWFWDSNSGRTQYLDRLLTEIKSDPEAAEHNYYFDVATAHLYFQPTQIYGILNAWRDIMISHGLTDKPFWLVETNAPVVDDPSWPVESITFNVTQRDQARFIPQALSLAFAAGAERISIFKLIDTESDRLANPEPFGLLRDDGSARLGFTAYQVAIDLLVDVTGAVRERWDEVGQVRLEHGDGHTTHVLFARKGQGSVVEIAALADEAELVNYLGGRSFVSAENGTFTIKLTPPECHHPVADYCMIGGDTYYLIQRPAQQAIIPTTVPVTTVAKLAETTEGMATPAVDPTLASAETVVFDEGEGLNSAERNPLLWILAIALFTVVALAILYKLFR
ncbi:MAG: hypothetical protein ACPG8W_03885 [Candidatus Promineifilaceae bacterium]